MNFVGETMKTDATFGSRGIGFFFLNVLGLDMQIENPPPHSATALLLVFTKATAAAEAANIGPFYAWTRNLIKGRKSETSTLFLYARIFQLSKLSNPNNSVISFCSLKKRQRQHHHQEPLRRLNAGRLEREAPSLRPLGRRRQLPLSPRR